MVAAREYRVQGKQPRAAWAPNSHDAPSKHGKHTEEQRFHNEERYSIDWNDSIPLRGEPKDELEQAEYTGKSTEYEKLSSASFELFERWSVW